MKLYGRAKALIAVLLFAAIGHSIRAEPSAPDEADFLSRTRRLTLAGRRAGEGYFHPSGKKLTFQSEREPGNPFYQIYMLDLTTGEIRRTSSGIGKTTCSFFRPGTEKVLFASTHLDPESEALQAAELAMRASGTERRYSWDYDEHYDIFEADAGGGGTGPETGAIRRLTDAAGYDAEGAYSPDGSRIVFTSNRQAYPVENLSAEDKKLFEVDPAHFAEIYIMNADGSEQTRLTSTPGYDGGPFFTPDGKRIVWRRFDPATGGMEADIYTMDLDGGDVRRLTTFSSMSWAPYFHPTGEYAIFASNKFGFENFELFLVDAEGEREPVRVTTTDGFDGLPVFNPAGDQLCWTSTRHGGGRQSGQLYMGQWNHGAALEALAAAPLRIVPDQESPASRPASLDETEAGGSEESSQDADAHAEAEIEHLSPEARLRRDVEFLASDRTEGRMTGSAGAALAAEYIVAEFERLGLSPLPGRDDFISEFEFTAGFSAGEDNRLSVTNIEANPHIAIEDRLAGADAEDETAFEAGSDFGAMSISEDGPAQGLLAFAGYGLVVPGEDGNFIYDSYGDLDVEGKIVLVLRFVPEDVEPETRQILNRYAGLRYKALQARERGAVGLLVVTGPNSPRAGELVRVGLDLTGVSSGIHAMSITVETANRLLASSEFSLGELQTELDSGTETPTLTLHDTYVRLNSDLIKDTRAGRNVIGMLAPKMAASGVGDPTEFIVIGAHYDHLGRGGGGNSLAHKGEQDEIHPGADDNASGVAGLLRIAAQMSEQAAAAVDGGLADPDATRGVIFAAWSGEELGLLGSADFTKNSPIALDRIIANLNMDMIGRLVENRLSVQGVGSSEAWRPILERANIVAGFDLALSEDPFVPSDLMSFYLKGVPGLHFFTGAHEDYHRPTDTADRVDYEGLGRTADFVAGIARSLARRPERPAYAKVERASGESGEGGRESLRAYLGTIPDYTEEIEGVKLAGVQGGAPADEAGLRAGDIVIKFAGQAIKNIYDYTYALDAVKIDEPVEMIVLRDGEELTITITPRAR